MKLFFDAGTGTFWELPIEKAHELAWEAEEPWRMHGPYAFEVISELTHRQKGSTDFGSHNAQEDS